MPSFEIVSEVDSHAFTNAVDQAGRVIQTRFDFRGVEAKFERKDLTVTVFAEAEIQLTQLEDMLRAALIKCMAIRCSPIDSVPLLFRSAAAHTLSRVSPESEKPAHRSLAQAPDRPSAESFIWWKIPS